MLVSLAWLGLPLRREGKYANINTLACPKSRYAAKSLQNEKEREMTIKAIHLFEHGFISQPFAFGGEDGKEAFDDQIYYRSSLQNFAVDLGDEVILVDTGLDSGLELPPREYGTPLDMGDRVAPYMDALATAGIDPGRVTKILVTHKHADHTDELKRFPDAEIFIAPQDTITLRLPGLRVNKCQFTDGPYFEFEKSQTIAPGVHYIFAPGHTRGNSIVVVESDGLFYMLAGDVTYCDAALKANKFSTATDDKVAARDTLNRVRTFIKARPTVRCFLTGHPTLLSRRIGGGASFSNANTEFMSDRITY